jgi:S-DNA-T family DNA segregation ATPase FtsK/SpoIIIE
MAALTQTRDSHFDGHNKTSHGALYRSRVFLGLIVFGVCAFLLLSLVSYDPRDPSFNAVSQREDVSNLCGILGSYLADSLVQVFGWASLMVPLGLFFAALRFMRPQVMAFRASELAMYCLLVCGVATGMERFLRLFSLSIGGGHPGGALGEFFHGLLERYVGTAGEVVLLGTIVGLSILYFSSVALHEYCTRIFSWRFWALKTAMCVAALAAGARLVKNRLWTLRSRVEGPATAGSADKTTLWKKEQGFLEPKPLIVEGPDDHDIGIHELERLSCLPKGDLSSLAPDCPVAQDKGVHQPASHHKQKRFLDRIKAFPWKPLDPPNDQDEHELPISGKRDERREQTRHEEMRHDSSEALDAASNGNEDEQAACDVSGIRVSERADASLRRNATDMRPASSRDDYIFPPLDLLDEPQISGRSVDKGLLETNARILTQKLAELGIQGQVVEIHPGPVITMYELALAPGIPLRKVLSTADDLAMALKSGSTRVVAPIPGKNTVGIEVPNLYREIVYFREIIESEAFVKSNEPLKVALGKGIDGEPFAASLTKMPHLLIAGATGTGKSVGLNCLICSWLMCCHPDDVKFLMVDPKKLELSYYQDIPHLIHPVVTDAEKVPRVLSWAIREMERRYDLLSKAGAKNIEGYNQKVLSGEITAEDGDKPPEKLPYIVNIVDELAELMMVAAKDIEISIARLAQMARASGIHLILATQRPSVDVITGVIKANFPARISFQVSAKPDSRTILDTTGAENLLGMGDMLFLPPGTAKLRRLHGAYVSENEIRRIADFIKAQRSPVYLQEITRHVSEDEKAAGALDLLADEKYDEAVELVTRLGHASISLIQRHMRIGYNRAARIIEMMESEGIIGPSDGTSRPREVLVRSLASIPDGDERPFAGAP